MLLAGISRYKLMFFDRIDSTNNEALRLAKKSVQEDYVIIAKTQTNGRGTKTKYWQSIAGNLHFSILIRTTVSISRITELPFLTSIVLKEAISEFMDMSKTLENITLKWPNDVLLKGRKVSGILIESICIKGITYVIIGVGINTHFSPDIPNVPTTSLLSEGGILNDLDNFITKVVDKFYFFYSKWIEEFSFNNLKTRWLKSAHNLNKPLTLDNGIQRFSGIFRGIDNKGKICIELRNQNLLSFSSGKITWS